MKGPTKLLLGIGYVFFGTVSAIWVLGGGSIWAPVYTLLLGSLSLYLTIQWLGSPVETSTETTVGACPRCGRSISLERDRCSDCSNLGGRPDGSIETANAYRDEGDRDGPVEGERGGSVSGTTRK